MKCELEGCDKTEGLTQYSYPFPLPGDKYPIWICPEHRKVMEGLAENSRATRRALSSE